MKMSMDKQEHKCKISSTGRTYARLKSEEDFDFSSEDGIVLCSYSTIASVIQ